MPRWSLLWILASLSLCPCLSVSGSLSYTWAGLLCLSLFTLPVLCVAFVSSPSPHMHTDVPLLTAYYQVEMRW